MYLKRHFVTTFNPEQIQEKLNKDTPLPFYKKAPWLISVNEQGFILTTPSKWHSGAQYIKIKGDVSPLSFNGGSKVELELTLSYQYLLSVFGMMAISLVGAYLIDFFNPPLLILMIVALFFVMSFVAMCWLSEKLKDELNGG